MEANVVEVWRELNWYRKVQWRSDRDGGYCEAEEVAHHNQLWGADWEAVGSVDCQLVRRADDYNKVLL